ncbi:hypothetical protein K6959_15970 [Bacillus aquiflavi]|uniref:NUDIX hydrolase n=1 Tax=Bacillus aquiflavi TaxID=2672567 RepID=UPI001CA7F735|nr:hypothetical protein [Bacillus aquiflavi]UAC48059.1 hypothetical protein K6959_15970 [Bacillus aquiflavi]
MTPVIIEEVQKKKMTIDLDSTPLTLPLAIREKHQLCWDEQKKQNSSLHNGVVFTITNMKRTPKELSVTVAKSDYKHYLYTINNKNCEYPCKVIYACAAVITKDRHLVIGRMNTQTSTPGRLQFPGGGIDETDLKGTILDLQGNMNKEIKEEIGINIHSPSVRSFSPKFLKHGGAHDFWVIIFEMLIEYTVGELKTSFSNHNKRLTKLGIQPEFAEILFVPLHIDKIEPFIKHEQSPKVDYLLPILLKYVENF